MCLSPILIPNPNLGYNGFLSEYKDTTSQYITVPCHYCSECIAVRQSSFAQRCFVESLNKIPFFATLTYNDAQLPILTTSQGYDIRFADWHDLHVMFKRLEKYSPRNFTYLAVSEFGSLRGRPHFHILFFFDRFPSDTYSDILNLESVLYKLVLNNWSRNYGSKRCPIYVPNCSFKSYFSSSKYRSNYDFHFVSSSSLNQGVPDVAFYITKYMFKESPRKIRLQQALKLNLPDDEYEKVWSIVRPRAFISKRFGLSHPLHYSYVYDCIRKSMSLEFPTFFYNEKSLPLSHYYQSRCMDISQYLHFLKNRPTTLTPLLDLNLSKQTAQLDKVVRLNNLFDLKDSSIFYV